MDESSKAVQKSVAVRSAAQAANRATRRRSSVAMTPAAFVQAKRSAIDFQILALQAEVKVLEELESVAHDLELLWTSLMDVLESNGGGGDDVEGKGKVDVTLLVEGLERTCANGGTNSGGAVLGSFQSRMASAKDYLLAEYRPHTLLNKEEFSKVATMLMDQMGCSATDLASILVMSVAFDVGPPSLSATMESAERLQQAHEKQAYHKATHDERMKALYKLFDFTHDGQVSFKEVVLGLYKLTDEIEGTTSKAAVEALLVMEANDSRSLTYEQFGKLIMNVVAAHPDDVKFEDIADKLTKLAAEPHVFDADNVQHLFAMDKTLQTVVEKMKAAGSELSPPGSSDSKTDTDSNEFVLSLSGVEMIKANRLFDMWDLDHDDKVNFQELSLGLRKFQETTAMDDCIHESVTIMNKFDATHEGRLGRSEFAQFLVTFAQQAKQQKNTTSTFLDLVDFMIVTTALKTNSDAEKAYIESLSAGDLYYYGC